MEMKPALPGGAEAGRAGGCCVDASAGCVEGPATLQSFTAAAGAAKEAIGGAAKAAGATAATSACV